MLLVVGGLVFFVDMLNPSLLPLAYNLSPKNGPSVYSLLELCQISGLPADSTVAGRIGARLRLPAPAGAIFVFGVSFLAIAFGTALAPTAISLSRAGNAVMNQTALLEAANNSLAHRTVMAARYAPAQAGKALGWPRARSSPLSCTPTAISP